MITRTYVVWYWDSKDRRYRIGRTFKNKVSAEKFADNLRHWEYIGITYSVKILDDAV